MRCKTYTGGATSNKTTLRKTQIDKHLNKRPMYKLNKDDFGECLIDSSEYDKIRCKAFLLGKKYAERSRIITTILYRSRCRRGRFYIADAVQILNEIALIKSGIDRTSKILTPLSFNEAIKGAKKAKKAITEKLGNVDVDIKTK